MVTAEKTMDEFEKMLSDVSSGLERFVRYRLPSQTDADDVLQEVYLSAYRNFAGLKNITMQKLPEYINDLA